jgi:hypothetical protein
MLDQTENWPDFQGRKVRNPMGTTISKLKDWFDEGVAKGATHMIVVCDTFDYEDYPVYVLPGEDFDVEYAKYDMVNMQRVMEV